MTWIITMRGQRIYYNMLRERDEKIIRPGSSQDKTHKGMVNFITTLLFSFYWVFFFFGSTFIFILYRTIILTVRMHNNNIKCTCTIQQSYEYRNRQMSDKPFSEFRVWNEIILRWTLVMSNCKGTGKCSRYRTIRDIEFRQNFLKTLENSNT